MASSDNQAEIPVVHATVVEPEMPSPSAPEVGPSTAYVGEEQQTNEAPSTNHSRVAPIPVSTRTYTKPPSSGGTTVSMPPGTIVRTYTIPPGGGGLPSTTPMGTTTTYTIPAGGTVPSSMPPQGTKIVYTVPPPESGGVAASMPLPGTTTTYTVPAGLAASAPPGTTTTYTTPGQFPRTTTTTTLVQTVPSPVVPLNRNLGRRPCQTKCPYCHADIITRPRDRVDTMAVVWMIVLLLTFWMFFWIPLVVPACKTTEHFCPNCNQKIGRTEACQ